MINKVKVECDLQTLMQVLNATGNSRVAMDILDGRYVEPNVYPTKIGRWETKKVAVTTDKDNPIGYGEDIEEKIPVMYHFVSYNPFKDEVEYTYNDSWRTNTMSLESWNKLEYPFNDADQAH